MSSNRSGNSGLYFRVLKFDSEYGLSLEVYGRLCVFVTPRSARRNATGLARCGAPRSACSVSTLGVICCWPVACSISALASCPVLAVLDRPADDVPTEHVENHIQVVVGPLRRALQLAHVPGATARSAARRAAPASRMRVRVSSITPLPDPAVMGGRDPVHRPGRTQVGALVQQRRPGLLWRYVDEPAPEWSDLEHLLALGLRQRPDGRRPRPVRSGLRGPATAVDRRRRRAQRPARRPGPDNGVSSSTVAAIIARCSWSRCRCRASLPAALRRFPGSPRPA